MALLLELGGGGDTAEGSGTRAGETVAASGTTQWLASTLEHGAKAGAAASCSSIGSPPSLVWTTAPSLFLSCPAALVIPDTVSHVQIRIRRTYRFIRDFIFFSDTPRIRIWSVSDTYPYRIRDTLLNCCVRVT